ncbi:MAG: CHAT domain-containing protein [Cyanobacteriota bacterium]|nr:CHAT domain-containing protein [Cyanobacteriota bacterium]
MTHAAANNLLRMLAAVPLAGFWMFDVSWASLPERNEATGEGINIPLPVFSLSEIALAQPILPEENSTGTIVTPIGGETEGNPTGLEVTGGRRSPDGSNLFHSFTQFNIEQNQTVNFVSSPSIQNILTRVNGGAPSAIDGLLQVTGGNSNLFIMNPAGIVFGANARLDVPGSFVATGASGIGFSFGSFDAFGNVDYEALNGVPTSFSFPTEAAGAIVNGGDLAVAAGENLLLIGGKVINTGRISSPGGQITIAAIPGENVVRISQDGHLLNLELEAIDAELATQESAQTETEIETDLETNIETETFSPLSLPELLTTGGSERVETATGITVEGDRVFLTASQQVIPDEPATAIVSGSVDVSSVENSLPSGGRVNILGDKIGLFDANINASGAYLAGNVRIGGGYLDAPEGFSADRLYVDENTTIEANSFFGEGGRVTLWSDRATAFFGNIAANGNTPVNSERESSSIEPQQERNFVGIGSRGNLIFDGSISMIGRDGSLSNLLLNSFDFVVVDTEIVPNSNLLIENTTAASQISAAALSQLTANTNLTVNVTNDIKINDLASDRLELENSAGQKVTLKADVDGDGIGSFSMTSGDAINTAGGAIAISGSSVTAGNINTSGGDLEISSTVGPVSANNISTAPSATSNIAETGGNITVNARGELNAGEINSSGDLQAGRIAVTSQTGSVEIAGTIEATSTNGRAGDINLKADLDLETGDIDARNGINFQDPVTIRTPGESGAIAGGGSITGIGDASITLRANRDITTGNISAARGVNINSAVGNITTGNISTNIPQGSGGNISISSSRGFVETGNLDSSGTAGGGNIEITASDRLTTGTTNASSRQGNGGAVTFNAGNDIEAVSITTEGGSAGTGGNLRVTTGGYFRVTGTVTDRNRVDASISTAGVMGPGAIAIQHGGGDCSPGATCTNTDFTVGDASLNGTAGAITDGEFSILPTQKVPNNFDIREVGEPLRQDSESRGSQTETETETPEESPGARTPETPEQQSETPAEEPTGSDSPTEPTEPSQQSDRSGSPTQEPAIAPPAEQAESEPESDRPQPGSEENPSGESQTRGNQQEATPQPQTEPTLFQAAKPTFRETQNPAPSPPPRSNPQPAPVANENPAPPREVANNPQPAPTPPREVANNPQPAPTPPREVANNPQPAPVTNQNPAPPREVANNPQPAPMPPREVANNPQPAPMPSPKVANNPQQNIDRAPEVLENSQVSSVLENPVGGTTLENLQLDSTALEKQEPTPPVLENLQAMPPITETPPPPTAILENPNTATPVWENPEITSVVANRLPTPAISDNSAVNSIEDNGTTIFAIKENVTVPALPQPEISPNNIINNQTNLTDTVSNLERIRGQQFISYLGENIGYREATTANIRESLSSVAKIGIQPAIIYVSARENYLELQLFLPDGRPIVKSIGKKRAEVLEVAKQFARKVRTPSRLDSEDYLPSARQLYDWLIEPLSEELAANDINMLIFSMDRGLRTIPLAALHDGKEFLVEKYSMGLIPSFSLTDTRYVGLNGASVLAMGASEFPTDAEQSPLPAVPTELSTIVGQLWPGKYFLNEGFTLDNLREQRGKEQFKIIHLATHGEFHPGGAENSYIQFWDEKLGLDRLRQLRLHSPQVELLVLSACTTAVGDEEAELGFAGLAVQAGVKSALASLWYVSDTATLGLMTEFYQSLFAGSVKAEALREAQLAMLRGELHLRDGHLYRGSGRSLPLPDELARGGNRDLSHPYYWAAFTTIGSPW